MAMGSGGEKTGRVVVGEVKALDNMCEVCEVCIWKPKVGGRGL